MHPACERRSCHSTASQLTAAMINTLSVYTFSFTLDWFQTVYAVAPGSTATNAARRAKRDSTKKADSTRWAIRYMNPDAAALVVAASRLILTATGRPRGANRRLHALPTKTKRGFPGGCGIPKMCAVAMYSDVSQKAVVGASVRT